MAGFEPATSCSQSRRANQAALHPDALPCGRGGLARSHPNVSRPEALPAARLVVADYPGGPGLQLRHAQDVLDLGPPLQVAAAAADRLVDRQTEIRPAQDYATDTHRDHRADLVRWERPEQV